MPSFGFVGPTYQSENPGADAERCVNLYPEIIESGRGPTDSKLVYYHSPGTTLFGTVASPVRALWGGNNRLFVLGGANLYELDITSGAIIATYTLAMPAGSGPGQIVFVPSGAAQGVTLANSGALLVWDGSPGSSAGTTYQNVWWVDGTTSTPPAVISAAGIGCIDGYGVALRPGCTPAGGAADPVPILTIDQTQFNLSAMFDASPGKWDPLQFAIKTGAADALLNIFTPGAVGGGGPEELWLIGKKTMEVWYDTGGTSLDPFPFQRVPGAFITEGLWAAQSVSMANNMITLLGGDDRGVGVVWAMNGYSPQRISNHAVEQAFQATASAGVDTSNAVSYTYQENGHTFYVLTFPGGRTFVADFSCPDASGRPLWHERGRGSTLNSLSPSWQFHTWTGGRHFVAGDGTGNVYVSSTGTYQDKGNAILRARIGPAISDNQKWVRHGQFWLKVGGPYQGVTRNFALDWSNDGGNTYGNQFNLGLQVDPTTQFGRVFMNNLGRSRQRNYRVQTTDNLPQCWLDADVQIG